MKTVQAAVNSSPARMWLRALELTAPIPDKPHRVFPSVIDELAEKFGDAPALVSDRTAARLWPGQDPLGQRFSRGLPGEDGFEVVGVAADAKITSLERTPPLMVYVPYWWRSRAAALSLSIENGSEGLRLTATQRGAL